MDFEAWYAELVVIAWREHGIGFTEPDAWRHYHREGYTPRTALEEDMRPEHYPISK